MQYLVVVGWIRIVRQEVYLFKLDYSVNCGARLGNLYTSPDDGSKSIEVSSERSKRSERES